MNKFLKKVCDKYTPKENRVFMEGYAYHLSDYIIIYFSKVLESFSKTLIAGLSYDGLEIVSPEEEFKYAVPSSYYSTSKTTIDISKSNIYLVKLNFSYKNKPLPSKYIYLPYFLRGGLCNLGGTLYHITPIVSDQAISLTGDTIFVKLLKLKSNFKKFRGQIVENGHVKPIVIIESHIYSNKNIENIKKETKAKPTIGLYLFSKFGFKETFKKYCGIVPIVGEMDITIDKYPRDKYIIFESVKQKPRSYIGKNYECSDIKVVIPIEHKNNLLLKQLIGDFIYIVDNFPNIIDSKHYDSKHHYRYIMGKIYLSGASGMENIINNMNNHVESLDNYLDAISITKLKDFGCDVSSFYDLLVCILENIKNWNLKYKEINESVFYRYLDVTYYVMFELTKLIFTVAISLEKRAKKKNHTAENLTLTEDEINKELNNITSKKIFKLVKSSSTNLAVNVVESPRDSLYTKFTSVLGLQECGEGVNRSKKKSKDTLPARVKTLSGSEWLIGSILNLPKKTPSPLFRLNIFAFINPKDGTINPPEEFKKQAEILNNLIKGREIKQNIDEFDIEEDIEDE